MGKGNKRLLHSSHKNKTRKQPSSLTDLDEIEQIFQAPKKHKANKGTSPEATQPPEKLGARGSPQPKLSGRKKFPAASVAIVGSKEDLFGHEASTHLRQRTHDGFPIYTEKELQLSLEKSGTTALCPFDCDCCF